MFLLFLLFTSALSLPFLENSEIIEYTTGGISIYGNTVVTKPSNLVLPNSLESGLPMKKIYYVPNYGECKIETIDGSYLMNNFNKELVLQWTGYRWIKINGISAHHKIKKYETMELCIFGKNELVCAEKNKIYYKDEIYVLNQPIKLLAANDRGLIITNATIINNGNIIYTQIKHASIHDDFFMIANDHTVSKYIYGSELIVSDIFDYYHSTVYDICTGKYSSFIVLSDMSMVVLDDKIIKKYINYQGFSCATDWYGSNVLIGGEKIYNYYVYQNVNIEMSIGGNIFAANKDLKKIAIYKSNNIYIFYEKRLIKKIEMENVKGLFFDPSGDRLLIVGTETLLLF